MQKHLTHTLASEPPCETFTTFFIYFRHHYIIIALQSPVFDFWFITLGQSENADIALEDTEREEDITEGGKEDEE